MQRQSPTGASEQARRSPAADTHTPAHKHRHKHKDRQTNTHTHKHKDVPAPRRETLTRVYIYIYICVCVCKQPYMRIQAHISFSFSLSICICVHKYVCVCICLSTKGYHILSNTLPLFHSLSHSPSRSSAGLLIPCGRALLGHQRARHRSLAPASGPTAASTRGGRAGPSEPCSKTLAIPGPNAQCPEVKARRPGGGEGGFPQN